MPSNLSPIESEVRSVIEQEGPISITQYMALCLNHPTHGYYTTGHPVGGRASATRTGGDFITAPEVSQMFGELIGIWCMEMWLALGKPSPFTLAEIGPGRGTLMKDLLRAARAKPDFLEGAQVHLVEISPALAEQQALTLDDAPSRITWLRDIAGLPDAPTLLIGNEFLDALPFDQWIKTGDQWVQRAVGVESDALTFTTRAAILEHDRLPHGHEHCPEGSIFETAIPREAFVDQVASHLNTHEGAALLIDYGHLEPGFGDTFQAIKNHAFCSPLATPGTADLTSHIDFAPLVKIAKDAGCLAPDPITQAKFLLNLGLLERAGVLGTDRDPNTQQILRDAVDRLAGTDQMGELFKVMAFSSNTVGDKVWPGFQ